MKYNKEAGLRPAICCDEKRLLEWANEPEVRRNSFDGHVITGREHREWFRTLMNESDIKQYIYEYQNQPVGQVRVNVRGEEAEIGYSIISTHRHQGHGATMMALLERRMPSDLPDVKFLTARVKTDNIASKRVFENMGYFIDSAIYRKVLKK